MTQRDIWCSTLRLLTESDSPGVAEARCLQQIQKFTNEGDMPGASAWTGVLDAMNELRRRVPRDCDTVH